MRGNDIRQVVARGVAVVCFVAAHTAGAQTTLFLQSVNASVSARSTALAGAYSAESFDASAMYWNPAALSFLHRSLVLFDHSRSADNSTFHYSLVMPFRLDENHAVAMGGTVYRWTDAGQPIELGRRFEYSIDLAMARKLSYSLSFGMSASLHYSELHDARLYAGFSSLGVYYSPTPEISYALVYHGIGLGSSLSHRSDQVEVVGWEPYPRRFELGMTMRYPSSRQERILTFSVANEKQVAVRGLVYKGGLELLPWSFLALRVGYLNGPDTESLRYGIGIMTTYFQVAYAYVPYGLRGRFHQLTLMSSLWD